MTPTEHQEGLASKAGRRLLPITTGLILLSSGCHRKGNGLSAAQLSEKLRVARLGAKTGELLKKYCPVKHLPKAHKGWLCAKTYLDWYLVGAFHADTETISSLAQALGFSCPKSDIRCGLRVVQEIQGLFKRLQDQSTDEAVRWKAEQARKLLTLQLEKAATWDGSYLEALGAMARSGPMAPEASVIVAGALADAMTRLTKAHFWQRQNLVAKLLGFVCPDDLPESCPFGCPELTTRLVQTRPELRKRLIALHCPLDRLGFTNRKQTLFISESSQRLARNLAFLTKTLTRLVDSQSPLSAALKREIAPLSSKLDGLVFPLPIPELAPTERGYRKTAFCGPAFEPAAAPVFVSLGTADVTAGIAPLIHTRRGSLVIPGMAELLVFPGRPIPSFDAESLQRAILQAEQVWQRETGLKPDGLTALLVDARVETRRYHRLMAALASTGRRKLRLIFRNLQGKLGGLTVQIVPCPDKTPRWKSRLDKTLAIWIDGESLLVNAATGPLADKPFTGPVTDLAGLRAALEHSRSAYRDIQSATLFLGPNLRYMDLSRVLGSIVRNSSGRTLYSSLSLSACSYGK